MDLVLTRTEFKSYGVFGELRTVDGDLVAYTLEHSYAYGDDPDSWRAKIPAGQFVCRRGFHRLAGMLDNFETFEITEVPGHSDILFHSGNVNGDSAGCVLVGSELGHQEILQSRAAFMKLMSLQDSVDTFILTVK